jgi:acetolactate synthase-1/2/3 large subunit
MKTCGEHLVELLADRGVTTVFGIPGVHTLELYRGLGTSEIRHITTRHEQGAGFMADGWGRVTDTPGVAIIITGPGVTNAMTPLAQARHDSTPLLVISAAVKTTHRGRQLGVIHDLPDQAAMTGTVTRRTLTVTDPSMLEQAVADAWAVLSGRSGPRGPVHLEVPMDILRLPAANGTSTSMPPALAPTEEMVGAASDLLAAAKNPAIILGGGGRNAGPAALALAEQLGAPVGLTINAKGAVPADHPLCIPSRMMFSPLDRHFVEADVVVVVGSQVSDLDWWTHAEGFEPQGRVIRIDTDERALETNVLPAVVMHGDATACLEAIAAALGRPVATDRVDEVGRQIAADNAAVIWPDELRRYLPTIRALDSALARNRIVAVDSTQPGYAANHALDVYTPGSWLMPIGFGCLGPALPMAIGAKLAEPTRDVIAIAGDGGFLFTLQELATGRDCGLPLPIIVWNNSGYGEIRDAMDLSSIPRIGTDASAFDYPAIARGFGCIGVKAETVEDVTTHVRDALQADRPTVIEVTPQTVGAEDVS